MTPQQFKANRQALNLSASALASKLGLGVHGGRWIRRIESTSEKDAANKPSAQLCKAFQLLIDSSQV